jgi:hypothetical protein
VQNQKDVLFLEKNQKNTNHYQFVLNDDAAQHFTPLPSKHKAKTTVPTKKLKASFRAYSSNFGHEIKLFSTYPYVAKDMDNNFESCLEFMHIISKLSLVFGNSHEFGKKRQLVSNSCFRIEKDSIQYDEDNFNEKEDLISSDDDYEDDWPDFNSQTQLHIAVAGAKDLNRKGNTNDYEDDRPDSQTQLHVTVAGAKVLNRKGKEL